MKKNKDNGLNYEVEVITDKKGILSVKPKLEVVGEARFEDYLVLSRTLEIELDNLNRYTQSMLSPQKGDIIYNDNDIGIRSYTG